MKILLKLRRQENPTSRPYFQTFAYEGNKNISVANLLNILNSRENLTDIKGDKAAKISWECSCIEKKCGACAMVINHKPRLACDSFLEDLISESNEILVEPLRKFPKVRDLRVDRRSFFNGLNDMKMWVEGDAVLNENDHHNHYLSSRCIMCGCCLEACPNFNTDKGFMGAVGLINASKIMNQNKEGSHRKEVEKNAIEYFFSSCDQTMACYNVCPMVIPIDEMLVKVSKEFSSI